MDTVPPLRIPMRYESCLRSPFTVMVCCTAPFICTLFSEQTDRMCGIKDSKVESGAVRMTLLCTLFPGNTMCTLVALSNTSGDTIGFGRVSTTKVLIYLIICSVSRTLWLPLSTLISSTCFSFSKRLMRNLRYCRSALPQCSVIFWVKRNEPFRWATATQLFQRFPILSDSTRRNRTLFSDVCRLRFSFPLRRSFWSHWNDNS